MMKIECYRLILLFAFYSIFHVRTFVCTLRKLYHFHPIFMIPEHTPIPVNPSGQVTFTQTKASFSVVQV